MTQLLLISLLLLSNIENNTQIVETKTIVYPIQIGQTKSDTLLIGIQNKIYKTFIQDLMSKDKKSLSKSNLALEKLKLALEKLRLAPEKPNLYLAELNKQKIQNLIIYWESYLQFYSSIYYLKKGDKETAEKEIDKGINCLKEIKNKNSEDYALLSMIQGFSMQFKGQKAMFISEEIKENLKRAIALDSRNLRAYYVYASNDFYTPQEYGGGKETESYLLKAISLPVQKIKKEYLPSWGKEEAFGILIKFYIKNESWDRAKKYFKEGIKLYPQSYTINQLERELAGK